MVQHSGRKWIDFSRLKSKRTRAPTIPLLGRMPANPTAHSFVPCVNLHKCREGRRHVPLRFKS